MCAKAIHHAGIVKVFAPNLSSGDHIEGLEYLKNNGIPLEALPITERGGSMKEMIDYFLAMITPPLEGALVLVSKPSEIEYGRYLDSKGYISPLFMGLSYFLSPQVKKLCFFTQYLNQELISC